MELLDKLEDLVEKSRQFMNTVFLNVDDFYTLTNKMRAALPEDMKAAARITRESDQIIADAKDQAAHTIDLAKSDAAKIIEDGKTEAARLVDASEIKRLATLQAKEIIASAEEEARATKAGADSYARDVLTDMERSVGKVMEAIQRGRDKLRQRSGSESDND